MNINGFGDYNPKWDRSLEEKKEKISFSMNEQKTIKKYEKKIYNGNTAFKKDAKFTTRINACKKAIEAYYEFKEFCYQSSGGIIYFQDMWEYCHNAKEVCFAYVEKLEAALEYLESNRTLLTIREKKLPTLLEELIMYLEKHSPILQKDLYLDFNPLLKSDIQKMIRELENEYIISRVKKSGTYEITLN